MAELHKLPGGGLLKKAPLRPYTEPENTVSGTSLARRESLATGYNIPQRLTLTPAKPLEEVLSTPTEPTQPTTDVSTGLKVKSAITESGKNILSARMKTLWPSWIMEGGAALSSYITKKAQMAKYAGEDYGKMLYSAYNQRTKERLEDLKTEDNNWKKIWKGIALPFVTAADRIATYSATRDPLVDVTEATLNILTKTKVISEDQSKAIISKVRESKANYLGLANELVQEAANIYRETAYNWNPKYTTNEIAEAYRKQPLTGSFTDSGLLSPAGVANPESPIYNPTIATGVNIVGGLAESIYGMKSAANIGAKAAGISKTATAAEWKAKMPLIQGISVSLLGGKSAVDDFNEKINMGLPLEQATTSAIVNGVFEVGTEYLPMEFFIRGRNAKLWKHLAKAAITEVPGELINTGVADAVNEWATGKETDLGRDMGITFVSSLILSLLMGTGNLSIERQKTEIDKVFVEAGIPEKDAIKMTNELFDNIDTDKLDSVVKDKVLQTIKDIRSTQEIIGVPAQEPPFMKAKTLSEVLGTVEPEIQPAEQPEVLPTEQPTKPAVEPTMPLEATKIEKPIQYTTPSETTAAPEQKVIEKPSQRVEKSTTLDEVIKSGKYKGVDVMLNNKIVSKTGQEIVTKISGNTIELNPEKIKETFDNKIWTKPRVLSDNTKATALPENQFNTVEDWTRFLLEHEIAHKNNKKTENETMGMYEDRINRIALQPEKNKAKELTTIINEMPTKKLKFPSLTTIISGGQTGADTIGLEVAKELGIKTGGTAAKGYKTENGSNPQLAEYGLVEDTSDNYAERTRKNVKNSDGTVYFYQRSNTPGYIVTKNTAEQNKKPFLENPTAKELSDWIIKNNIKTLNIAGNRGSKLDKSFSDNIRRILIEALTEEQIQPEKNKALKPATKTKTIKNTVQEPIKNKVLKQAVKAETKKKPTELPQVSKPTTKVTFEDFKNTEYDAPDNTYKTFQPDWRVDDIEGEYENTDFWNEALTEAVKDDLNYFDEQVKDAASLVIGGEPLNTIDEVVQLFEDINSKIPDTAEETKSFLDALKIPYTDKLLKDIFTSWETKRLEEKKSPSKFWTKEEKDWYYGRYRRRFKDYIHDWKTKEQFVVSEKYQEPITPATLAEQFDFSSDDNLEQNKKFLDDIFSNIKNKAKLNALKNNPLLRELRESLPKTHAYILNQIDETSKKLDKISNEDSEIQEWFGEITQVTIHDISDIGEELVENDNETAYDPSFTITETYPTTVDIIIKNGLGNDVIEYINQAMIAGDHFDRASGTAEGTFAQEEFARESLYQHGGINKYHPENNWTPYNFLYDLIQQPEISQTNKTKYRKGLEDYKQLRSIPDPKYLSKNTFWSSLGEALWDIQNPNIKSNSIAIAFSSDMFQSNALRAMLNHINYKIIRLDTDAYFNDLKTLANNTRNNIIKPISKNIFVAGEELHVNFDKIDHTQMTSHIFDTLLRENALMALAHYTHNAEEKEIDMYAKTLKNGYKGMQEARQEQLKLPENTKNLIGNLEHRQPEIETVKKLAETVNKDIVNEEPFGTDDTKVVITQIPYTDLFASSNLENNNNFLNLLLEYSDMFKNVIKTKTITTEMTKQDQANYLNSLANAVQIVIDNNFVTNSEAEMITKLFDVKNQGENTLFDLNNLERFQILLNVVASREKARLDYFNITGITLPRNKIFSNSWLRDYFGIIYLRQDKYNKAASLYDITKPLYQAKYDFDNHLKVERNIIDPAEKQCKELAKKYNMNFDDVQMLLSNYVENKIQTVSESGRRYPFKKTFRELMSPKEKEFMNLPEIQDIINKNQESMQKNWELVNTARIRLGLEPLKPRQNYVTHYNKKRMSDFTWDEIAQLMNAPDKTDIAINQALARSSESKPRPFFEAWKTTSYLEGKYGYLQPMVVAVEAYTKAYEEPQYFPYKEGTTQKTVSKIPKRTANLLQHQVDVLVGNPTAQQKLAKSIDWSLKTVTAGLLKKFNIDITETNWYKDLQVTLPILSAVKTINSVTKLALYPSLATIDIFESLLKADIDVTNANEVQRKASFVVGLYTTILDTTNKFIKGLAAQTTTKEQQIKELGVIPDASTYRLNEADTLDILGVVDKMANWLNFMQNYSEFFKRDMVYNTNYNSLIKQGYSKSEATKLAAERTKSTTFTFKVWTQPVAQMGNPITSLWYQFAGYSIQAGNQVFDMYDDMRDAKFLQNAKEAYKTGNLNSYINKFIKQKEGKGLRYLLNILYAMAFKYLLDKIFEDKDSPNKVTFLNTTKQVGSMIVDGLVPFQVSNVYSAFMDRSTDEVKNERLRSVIVPSAADLFLKPMWKDENYKKLQAYKTLSITSQLLKGKDTIYSYGPQDKIIKEMDKDQALRELFFSKTSQETMANEHAWNYVTRRYNKYVSLRKDIQKLIRADKDIATALEDANKYNATTINALDQLLNDPNITDARVKKRIREYFTAIIISDTDVMNWINDSIEQKLQRQ